MKRGSAEAGERDLAQRRRAGKRARRIKSKAHKYSRALHAYLSALAFVLLMFFAATGLLLNHPEWFAADGEESGVEEGKVLLTKAELDAAVAAADPERALAELTIAKAPILGAFESAEIFPDEEAYLRFSGAKGHSDVRIDFVEPLIEYEVAAAPLVEVLHNLHRGKDAGAVWSVIIDVSAIVILALSLFGFALMFFMKIRLVKSMVLFGGSAVALSIVYAAFVS